MTDDASSVLLHGRTIAAVRQRVCNTRQLARIDVLNFEDGPARGSRLVRIVNGGGLDIELLPDRCLDLGMVSYRGVPLAWLSPAPFSAPAFGDPAGTGWLRSFAGGFLTTCGLDHFGPPSELGDESFGMHGRATWLAAERLSVTPARLDDAGILTVEGTMRQASLFREHLVLERRLTTRLGSSAFTISDTVRNEGPRPAGHMVLYHLNLGWPIVDEGTSVSVPSASVEARDDDSVWALHEWTRLPAPLASGIPEQVLLHRFEPRTPMTVTVTNPRLGIALEVGSSSSEIQQMYMWRHFSDDGYVLGLEPSNCAVVHGRAAAEQAGAVRYLQPGESVAYKLTVTVRDLQSGGMTAAAGPEHGTTALRC